MDRITQKDLETLVKAINTAKGIENPQWNTVGSYQLSYAYGGVQLHRVCNTSGGVSTVSTGGYGTKRQLYVFMKGMLNGLSEKM